MNNWTRKHKVAALIIVLLGFLIRLLPLLPPEINLIRHIPDDAYYLYCEADNLVHGKGLTFDGVNPTTTGRPLYIVFLAGVDLVTGRGMLPQLAYLLGVLAELLTSLLILRFLRKIGITPTAALLGLVFYITSARIIFYGIDGMETPFAILSIIVLLNLYQEKIKSGSSGILPAIARGVTLAAMMLLRLDYIFIVVPVIFYELWLGIKDRRWDWFWVGATIGVIMAPWVWWSYATNGSLMPPSGDALTMIFAPKLSGGLQEISERIIIFLNASNSSLYLIFYLFRYNITASIVLIIVALIFILQKAETGRKLKPVDMIVVSIMVCLSILTLFIEALRWVDYTIFTFAMFYVVFTLIKKYNKFKITLLAIAPLAIGFIALTIYYTAFRLYVRLWNTIEGGLFISILLGALCAVLLKRRFRFIYIAVLICWVMASNIIISSTTLDKGSYPSQERFDRVVTWIQENIPPGTIIAAANGGIIQWYGGRTLVDAAGIEDIEAYKALKAHKLYDYLKKRNVQYLVDPKVWIFKYYIDYWGVDINTKLEEVYNTDPQDQDKYAILGTDVIKPIVYILK